MKGFRGTPGMQGQMQGAQARLNREEGALPTAGGSTASDQAGTQGAGTDAGPRRFAGDRLVGLLDQGDKGGWMSQFLGSPDGIDWLPPEPKASKPPPGQPADSQQGYS